MKPDSNRRTKQLVVILLAVFGIFSFILFWSATPGHALPEFAKRTGESCSTCHVSPGGGGPRTLRGLIWAARGKPDKVPELAGILAAPGATDGADLYEIACSSCHGQHGEGMFGTALVNSGLPSGKIRSQILAGRVRSGMPSFDGKFTPDQLDALVGFVADMSSGAGTPEPDSFPLDPGHLVCVAGSAPVFVGYSSPDNPNCGGN